ncbi:hypothetical protein GcM3_014029 [Golovinomyces cichoracearum]|uniref:3CxxC-type domain-containing protein n=1 Tax=Golovinomyces cichoracearum TaxID=62708 RepID=A0A420J9B0_9PEZI|nr:hypothetical protein GcM3_014029 [Golovinomyces cichoracearum]
MLDGSIRMKFNNEDSDEDCKTAETRVVGTFTCDNPRCTNEWQSGKISTVVRSYPNRSYNAKVFHQRCRRCNKPIRPSLDGSYADRVAHKVKILNNIPVVKRPFLGDKKTPPHDSKRCEGCKAGYCEKKGRFLWI